MRPAVALILALALVSGPGPASAALAGEEGVPAPAPPAKGEDASDPKPPPPFTLKEALTLLRRAEGNLQLHGLSMSGTHLDRAVSDYRRVIARMPEDADDDLRFNAHFALAFAVARADFPSDRALREILFKETLDALGSAAALDPEFPGLLLVEGMVREKMGDSPAAADLVTRGLSGLENLEGLQPWQSYQLSLFGLLSRGRAFMDSLLGREDLAEKDFTRALELAEEALRSPRVPRETHLRVSVLTHLAAALERLHYFPRCERILEALMRDDPGNAMHPYNMGLVKALQQKFDEAAVHYRAAARLDPHDPRPHLKIAYILFKYPPGGEAPDLDGTLEEIGIYRSLLGREDEEYFTCRADVAYLRGDVARAEEWVRKALSLNPECRQSVSLLLKILRLDPDPSAERKKETEALLKRLSEMLSNQYRKDTMDGGSVEMTFC